MIKEVIIEHAHEIEMVETCNFRAQRCYFYTAEELQKCQRSSGLKPFVHKQTMDGQSLKTIIQPYGYCIQDFNENVCQNQYGTLFKDKKWTPADTKTSAQTGRLSTNYKGLNPQLVLIEKEEILCIRGVKNFFFHVVVPDATSNRTVKLLNGVAVRGFSGVIPGTCVLQRMTKCPWFTFRQNKTKSNWKKRLGNFVFCFHPFQVKDGIFQWNIQSSQRLAIVQAPVTTTTNIALPDGMRVWDGIGLDDDLLATGYLVDMPIFSPLPWGVETIHTSQVHSRSRKK